MPAAAYRDRELAEPGPAFDGVTGLADDHLFHFRNQRERIRRPVRHQAVEGDLGIIADAPMKRLYRDG